MKNVGSSRGPTRIRDSGWLGGWGQIQTTRGAEMARKINTEYNSPWYRTAFLKDASKGWGFYSLLQSTIFLTLRTYYCYSYDDTSFRIESILSKDSLYLQCRNNYYWRKIFDLDVSPRKLFQDNVYFESSIHSQIDSTQSLIVRSKKMCSMKSTEIFVVLIWLFSQYNFNSENFFVEAGSTHFPTFFMRGAC